jgi:hypothetical protein
MTVRQKRSFFYMRFKRVGSPSLLFHAVLSVHVGGSACVLYAVGNALFYAVGYVKQNPPVMGECLVGNMLSIFC